jgi:hypothetical protein
VVRALVCGASLQGGAESQWWVVQTGGTNYAGAGSG